jgi:hypothetical protein
VFFFTRYFYPVFFVASIFAACAMQDVVSWANRRPLAIRWAAAGAFGLYALALISMGYTSAYRSAPIYHFYDVAQWVENNTAQDETIGVFQGGAIGYFSNRRVVNLDGKVNHHALDALKRGDIGGYIAEAGIDVVMDHSAVLSLFLGPWGDTGVGGIEARRVFEGASVGARGWVGFRLNGSGAAGAFLSAPVDGGSNPGGR